MRRWSPSLFGLLLLLAPAPAPATVPAQFVVENAVPGVTFDTPTGITYLPGGRMLVTEKRGRVWAVTNGVRAATPMWARENEVLNESDRGLLGIAVDPNYLTNRYVYLLYTVDPDSNGTDNNDDAFGRLTRYQVSASDSNLLDPASRTILIGATWRGGVPSGSDSHTIGDLHFAPDGTLLVSCGDGAQYNSNDKGGQDPGLFGATKTDPYEDIGSFRSQYIGSLAGKILRIDPATGLGLPSNPYYDGNGASNQSRVWCYGLRNPFRFTLRPGTGVTNPALANPGVLYIGDVGWTNWEEQNIAATGGLNFGWPCYEGIGTQGSYQDMSPAHHGCNTVETPSNPGTLTEPTVTYNHSNASVGTPPGFKGNTAIGGVFYLADRYPTQYRGQCFIGDFGSDWIKVMRVNASNQLIEVLPFATAMQGPVDFDIEPVSGDVIYVSIEGGEVRRIRWTGAVANNHPPVANASATPTSGQAPLAVSFSSAGSSDPDNDPLTFNWIFGDGQGASGASVSHTYLSGGTFDVILTVDDGVGALARDTVVVTVTGAPTSFPTTPVLDNFNRSNGPLASPWVDPVNPLSRLSIDNNALVQCCGYATPVWGATSFGPNQEAYVRLVATTPGAPEHDLMLKLQSANYNSAHIEVLYDVALGHVRIGLSDGAGGWGSGGTPIPVSFAAGDRFGARALSNGTVEVYKNGVLVGYGDASAWPYKAQGGYIGLTLDQAYSSRFDDFGGGNVTVTSNTKPLGSITSPLDGSFFAAGDSILLRGTGTDTQDTPAQLLYHWDVVLHHNNHEHPSAYVADGSATGFVAQNHDDGTGVWYEVKLEVTDRGGLADTSRVYIYPEIDLQPSSLAWSPPLPTTADSILFSFKVQNLGRMPAPLSRWRLVADGTPLEEGDVQVPARDSVALSVKVGPMASGDHVMRIVADTLATVTETSETNNGQARTFTIVQATGVDHPAGTLRLSNAYPNPAGGGVTFALELPRAAAVEFTVHDVLGRSVFHEASRELVAGHWRLSWQGRRTDGQTAPAGVYLAQIRVADMRFTRTFVLVR